MIDILLIVWNGLGLLLSIIPITIYKTINGETLNYLNPIWLTRYSQLNIIGALFHWIMYSLLCPLATIIYWIYKLFTFSVKK